MGVAAIIELAMQAIPILIQAGMSIEPVIERLISINADNITDADWQFLDQQRAAALAQINDTSKDV